VLLGAASGLVAVGGAATTGAFSSVEADRGVGISTASDATALLGLSGFDGSQTYQEPHEVTITNKSSITFPASSDQEASVPSSSDLRLRNTDTNNNTTALSIPTLDPNESFSFEIVTAPSASGVQTDTVTLSTSGSGLSIEAPRDISIEFDSGGQLVYATGSGQLKIYDAVNDQVITPATSPNNIRVVGANAVDTVNNPPEDSNADIPYIASNGNLYATDTGADTDRTIYTGNQPKLKKQKTRLSIGRWPPATSVSGDVILSADNDASKIYGIKPDPNNPDTATTEQIFNPGDGCGGVAGTRDIDGDGEEELIFMNSSQQIQYLNQGPNGGNGGVVDLQNGSVGSNNSAGFGPPVDFGNGVEIPFIDGSNNPAVIDGNDNKTILNESGIAKKAAVAPVDIDQDGAFEFMFIGSDNGNIKYIDNVRGSNTVETLIINGSPVAPKESVGLNSGIDPG